MKICWFDDNRFGLVEGNTLRDVSAALAALPAARYPAPRGDTLVANLGRLRDEIRKVAPNAPLLAVADLFHVRLQLL